MVEKLFFKYSKKYTTLRNLVNEGELVEKLVLEGYVEVFTEKLSTIEKYCIFPMLHMWGSGLWWNIECIIFTKNN
jgi:capsular polysaccharide biosynthesis protein